jgi:voltage-gated potassium channel Kch
MLTPLLVGGLVLLLNMLIQVAAIVVMIRMIMSSKNTGQITSSTASEIGTLIVVLIVLFAGHLVQITVWAGVFLAFEEFTDFATAFYHSTVNFATLGYGDIVMSERWRLLGAIQAASGVLMFGLSTSTLFAVMNQIFRRHKA